MEYFTVAVSEGRPFKGGLKMHHKMMARIPSGVALAPGSICV
jgi:hypothetical protein